MINFECDLIFFCDQVNSISCPLKYQVQHLRQVLCTRLLIPQGIHFFIIHGVVSWCAKISFYNYIIKCFYKLLSFTSVYKSWIIYFFYLCKRKQEKSWNKVCGNQHYWVTNDVNWTKKINLKKLLKCSPCFITDVHPQENVIMSLFQFVLGAILYHLSQRKVSWLPF